MEGVELRADAVDPPAAASLRCDDRQAMPLELLNEGLLLLQAALVHAVQVQHDVAVRVGFGRQEQFARVAGNAFGGPSALGLGHRGCPDVSSYSTIVSWVLPRLWVAYSNRGDAKRRAKTRAKILQIRRVARFPSVPRCSARRLGG